MSNLNFSIHPAAIVSSNRIGQGTRIWAFCNIQEKAVIGSDCNIGDHCFLENNVTIGDRVTIKNGVSVWDGVIIEEDVFVGPNAVFTNDIYPRSKVYRDKPDKTVIRKGATIGANATVIAGCTIGRYAFIGAGAVVTGDVPDFTLWYGNPARQAGYVCMCARQIVFDSTPMDSSNKTYCRCACGLKYRLVDGYVLPEPNNSPEE
ncbi:MAG: acyltransferase [candidate division Zixibacteria bacterium]|nr:acyltransferase [candidate division Zixibacteria bacterium]